MKTLMYVLRAVLVFSLLLGSTIVFTGCAQSFADSRAPGNPDFQSGKAYYQRQDYQNAVSAFQRALQSNPDGWLFRNWLGMSYYNLKEYDKAIENLKVSNRGRETADNHYFIAESYYHLGNYDKSIKHYNSFLQMGRDHFGVHYHLGMCYLEKGDYGRAISEFNHANQMKRDIKNDAGIAKAYIRMREYAQAAPFAKKWALGDSYNEEAHQLLGVVYTNLKIYDEAIKEFQRANLIRQRDKNYEGLGDVYCKVERYSEAVDAYSKGVKITKSIEFRGRVLDKISRCRK